MADYTIFLILISNVGFLIVIAIYLIHQFEPKLDALVENIQILSQVIEEQTQHKKH